MRKVDVGELGQRSRDPVEMAEKAQIFSQLLTTVTSNNLRK